MIIELGVSPTLSDVRHYAKILQWALIVRPHLLVRWRGPVSCNQSLEMSPSQGRVTAKVSVVFAQHFQTQMVKNEGKYINFYSFFFNIVLPFMHFFLSCKILTFRMSDCNNKLQTTIKAFCQLVQVPEISSRGIRQCIERHKYCTAVDV